ncbi:MAG TPA: hypothetical protein VFG28_03215 [Syntrophales bacterium]|nr:hypothetical protein [Syntrophales bacterium]
MLPDAYISHRTPTRLRVRVPSRKRDLAWFIQARDRLAEIAGVEAVDVNELSGSILIVHGQMDIGTLLAAAKKQGLFQITRPEARKTATLRQDIANGFRTVNRRVSGATGGYADLWDVAVLGLAGAGVYQLLRGNIAAPMWYTAFWYAFGIYIRGQSADVSSK